MWPFTKTKQQAEPPTQQTRFSLRPEFSGPFGVELDHLQAPGEHEALKVPALHNAVRVISELVASCPLVLLRRADRSEATDHPKYKLLAQPNPYISAFSFKQRLVRDSIFGNGFAEIVFDGRGNPIELWNVPAANVLIQWRSNTEWFYRLAAPITGQTKDVAREMLVHIPGQVSADGVWGEPLTHQMHLQIQLARQIDEWADGYFRNNLTAGGWLRFPAGMDEAEVDTILTRLKKALKGARKAFGWVPLENPIEPMPNKIDADATKILDLREEVDISFAQFLNLNPIWLSRMGRATWANSTEMWNHVVRSTLIPYALKLEEELSLKLLTAQERQDYFVECDLDELLRGDQTERFANYAVATGGQPWMTPDDVKREENLRPAD